MAFQHGWIELVCPRCWGELHERPSTAAHVDRVLHCAACPHDYEVVLGIPDLRIFPDPYISAIGDQVKGRMLATTFEDSDLAAMARLYYHITPETPPRDVELNLVRLQGAVARASATLTSLDASLGPLRGERLLEVGCGTAPMLIATADRFPWRVGVDVSFRWLVMARRRLADHGVEVPLVAACGEALPFRNGTFDTVLMDSYLEITADQDAALEGAARVLAPKGRLVASTPNRFSVGPDPHVGVPGGGYLPQFVVNSIARQRMARPPLRHLLGPGGLARAMRRAGFRDVRVQLAQLSDAQLATQGALGRMAGTWFNRLSRLPVARQLLRGIGPILHASGHRA